MDFLGTWLLISVDSFYLTRTLGFVFLTFSIVRFFMLMRQKDGEEKDITTHDEKSVGVSRSKKNKNNGVGRNAYRCVSQYGFNASVRKCHDHLEKERNYRVLVDENKKQKSKK